jgi:spermidine synthase
VVEINPAIVPVAREWFDFDPGAVRLVIDDARHFLRVSTNRYDTVQLDAFLGDASPSHLMTREAFAEIRRVLEPGGTLVINSFARFEAGRDFFGTSLHRTLSTVFKQVVVHAAPGGNMFFVASDRDPLTFTPPTRWDDVHPACLRELQAALAKSLPVDSANALLRASRFPQHEEAQYRDDRLRLHGPGPLERVPQGAQLFSR